MGMVCTASQQRVQSHGGSRQEGEDAVQHERSRAGIEDRSGSAGGAAADELYRLAGLRSTSNRDRRCTRFSGCAPLAGPLRGREQLLRQLLPLGKAATNSAS